MEMSRVQFPADDLTVSYYRKGMCGMGIPVCKSGLQKQIRRNVEGDALKWMMILLGSFGIENLWNRILIILSEDIGIGNLYVLAKIRKFHQEYILERKSIEKEQMEVDGKKIKGWRYLLRNSKTIRQNLAEAVILLSRSPKSRMADDMVNVYKYCQEVEVLEHELVDLMIEAKKGDLEVEKELIDRIGSYVKGWDKKERCRRMSFIMDCVLELVDGDRLQYAQDLEYMMDKLNSGSGDTTNGNLAMSQAVLLLCRRKEELGYVKIEVSPEELEITERICEEMVSGTLDLDVPEYIIDLHVRGTRDRLKAVKNFIDVEVSGLEPKWDVPNPHLERWCEELGKLDKL